MTFRIFALRTVRRRHTFASGGCARWRIYITGSPYKLLPMNSAHRAKRDPADYLLALIGQPRTIDFKGVDYPNYGASLETYPWETAVCGA